MANDSAPVAWWMVVVDSTSAGDMVRRPQRVTAFTAASLQQERPSVPALLGTAADADRWASDAECLAWRRTERRELEQGR